MTKVAPWALLLGSLTGCLFPQGPLDVYCGSDCTLDAGSDAGDGPGQLPDAGAGCPAACPGGEVCDLGSCHPACGQGCPAGSVCDPGPLACLPDEICPATACAVGETCVASVCTAAPNSSESVAGLQCGSWTLDGGAFKLSISILGFPDHSQSDVLGLVDGGSVLIFVGDGGAIDATPAVGSEPGWTAEVPEGSATFLVRGPGVVPTYFPGIALSGAGSRTVTLADVVTIAGLARLSASPEAGLFWVGEVVDCTQSYVTGYTVGLRPAPAFLDRVGSGQFLAMGAAVPTSYVVALGSSASSASALLSGSFIPPPDAGAVAVALIFPDFTR